MCHCLCFCGPEKGKYLRARIQISPPEKKKKKKFGFINVLKQPHGALSPDDCTDEPQLGSLVLFDVRLNAYSEKEKLCYRDYSLHTSALTAKSSNSLNTFLMTRIELLDLTSIHLGVVLPMKLSSCLIKT